jgi:hypothetical protein
MNRVRIGHISMQQNDSPNQQKADTARVFARANKMKYGWLTGTEGNHGDDRAIYRAGARKAKFRYAQGGDVWIAVPAHRVAGAWSTRFYKVIDGRGKPNPWPRFPTRGVLRVSWKDTELGYVTVLASHFQSRRVSKVRPQDNVKLTDKIGQLARRWGAGGRVCFYGGDQNILDDKHDTFKGEPMTSCWDELRKHPNTGHGNIDVIASYDGDRNVSCESAGVLNDAKFHLFTDHFLVEAVYKIGAAKR